MTTRNESLLVLQSFMATMTLIALPIAALVAEHRRAVAERESLRALAERQHAWLRAVLDQMQAAVIIAEDLRVIRCTRTSGRRPFTGVR